MGQQQENIYTLIGGQPTIQHLVNTFYDKVEADEKLRTLFPENLEPGKEWQILFLTQLFGGPATYSEKRGHPRLRMRHFPFSIDAELANIWLKYMLEAIDEIGIKEPARSAMEAYFNRAAPHMINSSPSEDITHID